MRAGSWGAYAIVQFGTIYLKRATSHRRRFRVVVRDHRLRDVVRVTMRFQFKIRRWKGTCNDNCHVLTEKPRLCLYAFRSLARKEQ